MLPQCDSVMLARRKSVAAAGKGTISEVIAMLEEMQKKSKEEGEKEKELYAKFKCYCDDNEKEKTQSVEDLTKEIGLLGNEIADLQGSNGKLSMECAQLKTDMDNNEQAVDEAKELRKKEKESFEKEEKDLKA